MLSGAADLALENDVVSIPVTGAHLAQTKSTSLAAAPAGIFVTHPAMGEADMEELSFMGTLGGAPGEYSCTGNTCSVTLDDKGAVTEFAGAWSFEPGEDAKLLLPDTNHLVFGYWMNAKDDGKFDFQTFAMGVGYATATPAANGIEGSATYSGAAGGAYVLKDVSQGQVTGATDGRFTANATLHANFLDADQAGVISGLIDGFANEAGESMAGWGVTLKPTALTNTGSTFAGETSASIGSGTSGSGAWEGTFYGGGGNDNDQPTDVVGQFDAHFPGAHVAGAYGATKDMP